MRKRRLGADYKRQVHGLNYKQTHAVEANNILLRADQFDKNHTKGTRCP